MCGYGRFGRELTADLRAEGLEVTVIEPTGRATDPGVIVGDASEPRVLERADLERPSGFVAGTDNDTTNLSMLAAARRMNPALFLAARQNRPTSAAAVRGHAAWTRCWCRPRWSRTRCTRRSARRCCGDSSRSMPAEGDAWAADVLQRLLRNCGPALPALWKIKLDRDQAPALRFGSPTARVRLGDLLRSPEDRERRLRVVPLLLRRGADAILTPDDDIVLEPDDELLFAGEGAERRELESTLVVDCDRGVRALRPARAVQLGLAQAVQAQPRARRIAAGRCSARRLPASPATSRRRSTRRSCGRTGIRTGDPGKTSGVASSAARVTRSATAGRPLARHVHDELVVLEQHQLGVRDVEQPLARAATATPTPSRRPRPGSRSSG